MNMPNKNKKVLPSVFYTGDDVGIVYHPLSENDFLYYWDDQCV